MFPLLERNATLPTLHFEKFISFWSLVPQTPFADALLFCASRQTSCHFLSLLSWRSVAIYLPAACLQSGDLTVIHGI